MDDCDYACIDLPEKMVGLFEGEYRYRVAKGGRGSAKTRGMALMSAIKGYILGMQGRQGQILCAREHLNSIDESSMAEIMMAIQATDEETGEYLYPWLVDYYDIGTKYIRSRDGRIEFVFAGLRRNLNSIKSKARLLLCWVDEAETVPESSWSKLIPTVREEGSEIWVSYNPEVRGSATDERFVQNPSDDVKVVTLNYMDNPWFPAVLEAERLNDYELRRDVYDHIWLGAYYEYAEGAYYLNEMRDAAEGGRIDHVPHDPALGVMTAWDLGMRDSTAIWFAQEVNGEMRIIDYYEAHGEALAHYVSMLHNKRDKDKYNYTGHILPHDVQVRELGTGKSRYEVLMSLGVNNITIAPQLSIDDGIQQVRMLLSRSHFNEETCREGIRALRQYRREFNDKMGVWHSRPCHDWTSHGADAFRYLAVGRVSERGWGTGPIKRNVRGIA